MLTEIDEGGRRVTVTKSDQIRALARDGVSIAEIARKLNIRYQFAYNVTQRAGIAPLAESIIDVPLKEAPPPLTVEALQSGGFEFIARWELGTGGDLTISSSVPKREYVYAFATVGVVRYVGVTLRSLDERMRAYRLGHRSQPTNERMRERLKSELRSGTSVEIYAASPPPLSWNNWAVNGAAGLEIALISNFDLEWNTKGSRRQQSSTVP